jgi:hypothetical protein
MAGRILTLNEKQVALDEKIVTTVSLAVILHDDFASGKQPIGKIKVSLQEQERQAFQNLSGYYLFTNVEGDTHTIQVTSDYYFDPEEEEVVLSSLDSKNPVVDITLKPMPFYPFPPGTTLMKGVVKNSSGEAVSGATVTVESPALETQTTEKGEFVFYFTGLTEDDIIEVNNQKFVRGNGDQTITLEVTHPDYTSKQVQIEAEESKTTSVSITI